VIANKSVKVTIIVIVPKKASNLIDLPLATNLLNYDKRV